LGIAFGDVLDFVLDNLSSVVPFPFAHQLAVKGMSARRHGRARDKDKNLEVFQAAQLIMAACNPILMLRGGVL